MEKRILVIDDDQAIRESFSLVLQDSGYNIDTTSTGQQALAMAKKNKYNLIFIDLKMTDMTGIEVLRQIRKIDKEVHIYILTAFYKEFFDELKVAEKEGLKFQLLKKPIDMNLILFLTKSILESPHSLE